MRRGAWPWRGYVRRAGLPFRTLLDDLFLSSRFQLGRSASRLICQLDRSSHWRQLLLFWMLSDTVHVHVLVHELNLHCWDLFGDLPMFDLRNLEDVRNRISSIFSTSCGSGLVTCFCTCVTPRNLGVVASREALNGARHDSESKSREEAGGVTKIAWNIVEREVPRLEEPNESTSWGASFLPRYIHLGPACSSVSFFFVVWSGPLWVLAFHVGSAAWALPLFRCHLARLASTLWKPSSSVWRRSSRHWRSGAGYHSGQNSYIT